MKPVPPATVLARLAAQLRRGDAETRTLDVVSSWTGPAFFRAIDQLLLARRPDLARALLAGGTRALRDPIAVAWWQAQAALDLGDLAAAAAARDAIARAPSRAALIDARLAIARGEPARAAALAAPIADPHLATERVFVLADAAAASGDREGARVHLRALGRRALARLASSSRPSAALAAELRAGAVSPYR